MTTGERKEDIYAWYWRLDISSQLEGLIGASLSLASPLGVAIGVSSSTEQMSSIEKLAISSCLNLMASEGDTCTIGASKIGSERETFERVFLTGRSVVESAYEKRLRCLSLKSVIRFGAIYVFSFSSSSSSDSRIMLSTTGPSSRFGLSPTKGDSIKSWLVLASIESEWE